MIPKMGLKVRAPLVRFVSHDKAFLTEAGGRVGGWMVVWAGIGQRHHGHGHCLTFCAWGAGGAAVQFQTSTPAALASRGGGGGGEWGSILVSGFGGIL